MAGAESKHETGLFWRYPGNPILAAKDWPYSVNAVFNVGAVRLELGDNLRHYLDTVVSWDIVADQYDHAYTLARESVRSGKRVELPGEF